MNDLTWYWTLACFALIFFCSIMARWSSNDRRKWYHDHKNRRLRRPRDPHMMSFRDTDRLFKVRKEIIWIQILDGVSLYFLIMGVFRFYESIT